MLTRRLLTVLLVAAAAAMTGGLRTGSAEAAGNGQPVGWQRDDHPQVDYPENFQPQTTFHSMSLRKSVERRIPVYYPDWHNVAPSSRPYYSGNSFIVDVF
ncbi:MAG: hypothetical protein KDA79_08965 [Planctomycetaceae bacterium]|nr:hypothetical protein [Planctomycetaceae bacterium]